MAGISILLFTRQRVYLGLTAELPGICEIWSAPSAVSSTIAMRKERLGGSLHQHKHAMVLCCAVTPNTGVSISRHLTMLMDFVPVSRAVQKTLGCISDATRIEQA